MISGMISLRNLYDLIRSDASHEGLIAGSLARRCYGQLAAEECSKIAAEKGFYLWGRYDQNGLWRNIYLGKAGFGKTAMLRARIVEELKDERTCLWRAFVPVDLLLETVKANHRSMWKKYQVHMERSLKKAGVTHIVWVSCQELSNEEVREVESDLIETLNPRANVSRPVPPTSLQKHTKRIVAQFRAVIHENRYKDRRGYNIPDVCASEQ